MSLHDIILAGVTGTVATAITAWATLRGKEVDTLHLSEVEFRKALLSRITQLERRREMDSDRIQELEGEVRTLQRENDVLRRGTP